MNRTFIAVICILMCFPAFAAKTAHYQAFVSQMTPLAKYIPKIPLSNPGNAHLVFHYDDLERIVEIIGRKDGASAPIRGLGVERVKISYTDNELIRSYWHGDGTPAFVYRHFYSGGKIHKEVFTLNGSGKITSLRFEDERGNPVSSGTGAFVYHWTWLTDSEVIETRLDQHGKGVVISPFFDFYRTKIRFDHRGIQDLVENVNSDCGRVTAIKTGISAIRFNYDQDMNEAGYSFYDEMDQPVNSLEGDFRTKYVFNEDKRLIEESHFDTEGNLVSIPSLGYARLRIEWTQSQPIIKRFDENNNLIE